MLFSPLKNGQDELGDSERGLESTFKRKGAPLPSRFLVQTRSGAVGDA